MSLERMPNLPSQQSCTSFARKTWDFLNKLRNNQEFGRQMPQLRRLVGCFKELVLSDGVQIICECEECSRLRFSGNLVNLLQNPKVGKRLKVVITSRPYSIIRDGFDSSGLAPGQFQRVGHISEETQQIEKEVSNFIYSKIQHFQRTRQRRIGVYDNVHLTLQKWVMGKINRNYLWASFILKELEKNAWLPMDDLKDVIETLPSTCSEAYEKILRQSTYPKKARIILKAVLGAARPPSLSELYFVLSMRNGEEEGEDVNYIQILGFTKTIEELCGFFITVDEGKVYLMHQTTKEFLLQPSDTPKSLCGPLAWEHSLCIEAAHELLARTCIQYLQLAVFEERPLQVDDEFLFYDRISDIHLWHQVDHSEVFARIETYLQRHQFLQYAARHWFEHYELSSATGDERWAPLAIKICDVQSKSWRTWFTIYVSKAPRFISSFPFRTTLEFISWLGFTVGIKQLLRDYDFSNDELALSVNLAMLRGHRGVTQLSRHFSFRKRSRQWRLRNIDKVLREVEEAFKDASPELQRMVEDPVSQLRRYRELLAEEIELAAELHERDGSSLGTIF